MSSVATAQGKPAEGTAYTVIFAVAFCHMLNDMMQSLIPSIYPNLKTMFDLNFTQIGLITLVFQVTASLLQPLVGLYGDRKAIPYLLPAGAVFTLVGLLLLGLAQQLRHGAGGAHRVVGIGSSVFHPESSRVARMASGGRHRSGAGHLSGRRQCRLGASARCSRPSSWWLMAMRAIAWCSLLALLSIVVLWNVGRWYKHHGLARLKSRHLQRPGIAAAARAMWWRMSVLLLALIFSKFFYLASITSYYTFYLIHHFHLSVRDAQLHLFLFLARWRWAHSPAGRSATATAANISSGFPFWARCRSRCCCLSPNLFWTGVAQRGDRPGAGLGVSGHRGLWRRN